MDGNEENNPFEGFATESSRDGVEVENDSTDDAAPTWDDEEDQTETLEETEYEDTNEQDDDSSGDSDDADESGDTDGDGEGDAPGNDAEGENADEPHVKKKKKPLKARLGEVSERARNERDARVAAEAELELYKSGKLKAETPADETAADGADTVDLSDLERPDPSKYEYGPIDDAYLDARAEYAAAVAVRKQTAKSDKAAADVQAAQEIETLEKNWVDNVQTPGVEKYDDFDEVVLKAAQDRKFLLSPELGTMISESKHGAQIMYELASDVDEANRVYELSPLKQAAYFGKVESRLSPSGASKKNKPKTSSKAPKPVRQPTGRGAATGTDPATKSFADFERMAVAKER